MLNTDVIFCDCPRIMNNCQTWFMLQILYITRSSAYSEKIRFRFSFRNRLFDRFTWNIFSNIIPHTNIDQEATRRYKDNGIRIQRLFCAIKFKRFMLDRYDQVLLKCIRYAYIRALNLVFGIAVITYAGPPIRAFLQFYSKYVGL